VFDVITEVTTTFSSFHCVSTDDLSSAGAVGLCRGVRPRRPSLPVAPFTKRPHLSAVSLLKSVADFLAGTGIAVQPSASSEEAEL
jgi:hypothetical protein